MTTFSSVVAVGGNCDISIGWQLAAGLRPILSQWRHILIVHDANTHRFSSEIDCLAAEAGIKCDFECLRFVGERNKSPDEYLRLMDVLVRSGFQRRQSCLIALGGGTISDVVGFAAATLFRGVSYVNVPTTLVGIVDASIGGKVGINLSGAKHGIGAFHWPAAVVIGLDVLKTLPERQYASAFGEIVKVALVSGDESFFRCLEHYAIEKSKRNVQFDEIITRAVRAKLALVEPDWLESQLDRLLNLGHEVAHTIEAQSGFNDSLLLHGELVAVGILAAAVISERRSLLSTNDLDRIYALIRRTSGLDQIAQALPPHVNHDALDRVKQIRDGQLRVVLPKSPLGTAEVNHDVTHEELAAGYHAAVKCLRS